MPLPAYLASDFGRRPANASCGTPDASSHACLPSRPLSLCEPFTSSPDRTFCSRLLHREGERGRRKRGLDARVHALVSFSLEETLAVAAPRAVAGLLPSS